MSSDKKAQSEEIEDQIAKFLREGGEIEKIEEGASSFKPILNSKQNGSNYNLKELKPLLG